MIYTPCKATYMAWYEVVNRKLNCSRKEMYQIQNKFVNVMSGSVCCVWVDPDLFIFNEIMHQSLLTHE